METNPKSERLLVHVIEEGEQVGALILTRQVLLALLHLHLDPLAAHRADPVVIAVAALSLVLLAVLLVLFLLFVFFSLLLLLVLLAVVVMMR